ncbi:MAG: hypothetical protein NXI31_24605 [bacterium]|nr:hypothetical protein [bacterium]
MRFPYVLAILCALLLVAVVLLVLETRAVAELAGRNERLARAAQLECEAAVAQVEASSRELTATSGQLATTERERDAARAATERLEHELARAAAQVVQMTDAVKAAKARADASVAAAKAESMRALEPMPEGVRLCLQALHACLKADGFSDLRFLRARALDDNALHDVEMLQAADDRLGANLVVAKRMTAKLERSTGQLVLTFYEGTRNGDGERVELDESGWPLIVAPVSGHLIEERLPHLVECTGEYPSPEKQAAEVRPTDVDPVTRMQWLERFEVLLGEAGTTERLDVRRFRGMEQGHFLGAELLATDARGHVQFGAACERLAVEVDERAGIVSLVLRDGQLRRGLAESTITAEGYRILLPKLRPERASEIMLGLVVRK